MKSALVLSAAALALAACGSTAAAAHSPGSGGPSPRANAGARNGAAGQITQLHSSSLVLKTASGAANVAFTGSTAIVQTTTGSVSDIVTGACVLATGQPNAAGGVTAMTVTLSAKVNGACTVAAARGAGNGAGTAGSAGGAGGNRAGRGGASPNPNFSFIRGEVTGVDGSSVTVQPPSGAAQTFTVSDTAQVTKSVAATASQLAVGQCVVANGQRDSSGTVHATTMSIVPAGRSGCLAGFPGGGRFGPGGRPSPGSSPSQQ